MGIEDTTLNEEGVSEEEQEVKIHPRLQALEDIAKTRKQEFVENGVTFEDDDEDLEEEEEGEPKEKEVEVEEKKEDEVRYSIKVDGVEEEKTVDELIRGYQKDTSASKKLYEATELKKALEEKEAKLTAREEKLLKQLKDKEEGESKEDTTFDIDPVEIAKLLREGEDSDAAKAIQDLVESVSSKKENKGISKEDIAELVSETIRTEREAQEAESTKLAEEKSLLAYQEEADKAEKNFNDSFEKEIKDHEDFFDMSILQDQKLQKDPKWENKSLLERYEEAGKRAKKILGLDKKDLRKKKLEKKEKLNNLSSASARDSLGEDEKIETPSSIIADIKKRRGQMV
jgi:hypothetical protein